MEEPPQSWELGPEDSSSQAFSGPGGSRLCICSAQTLPRVLRPPLPTAPSSLLAPISSSSWLPSEAPAHLPGLPPSSPTVPSLVLGTVAKRKHSWSGWLGLGNLSSCTLSRITNPRAQAPHTTQRRWYPVLPGLRGLAVWSHKASVPRKMVLARWLPFL